MEDYKKKYEDALRKAKENKPMEEIFPELKESEDEKNQRIKKEVVEMLHYYHSKSPVFIPPKFSLEDTLAWLEKHGEKTNPYSGISFEYNGHIWGMCARDNGVDILCDKHLIKHLEKQDGQKHAKTVKDVWKNMRLEAYAQATGNRHEPNYSDDSTKLFSLNDIDEIFEKISDCVVEQKPLKVYRVENETEEKGLWRKFDGTWQPLFDMLTDGKCKDMPMEDNPIYREGGKRWFASAPSKEALQEWFSKRDLEELVSKGFTITEFEVTEYKKVSDFEYIFTRDNIINKSYLKVSDIYSEQKPDDKVEPKFKAGDWVIDKQGIMHQIAEVIENVTNHTYGYDIVGGGYFNDNAKGVRLWTIQDAKDGDVLHSTGFHSDCVFIFNGLDNWKLNEPNGDRAVATGYCCLVVSADKMEFGMQGPDCIEVNTVKPATKIQRDLLFSKMKEAGYEWDAKEKELKKIEQNSIEPDNLIEESYQRQADDLFDMVTETLVWSEEDERMVSDIDNCIKSLPIFYETIKINGEEKTTEQLVSCARNWLKSLKDRVQPKQKWSEEDEEMIRSIRCYLNEFGNWLSDKYEEKSVSIYKAADWLKSLKPNHWKPSDEQMNTLEYYMHTLTCNEHKEILFGLYTDLKKLREEQI